MAGNYFYGSLRNAQIDPSIGELISAPSEKVFSFNQQKFFRSINPNANTMDACLPISLIYIHSRTKQLGGNGPFSQDDQQQIYTGLRTSLRDVQTSLGHQTPAGGQQGQVEALERAIGLTGQRFMPTISASMARDLSGIYDIIPNGGAALVGIYLTASRSGQSDVGHAVALFKESPNRKFFFDPEAGEYRVVTTSRFFDLYATVCMSKLHYQYPTFSPNSVYRLYN